MDACSSSSPLPAPAIHESSIVSAQMPEGLKRIAVPIHDNRLVPLEAPSWALRLTYYDVEVQGTRRAVQSAINPRCQGATYCDTCYSIP